MKSIVPLVSVLVITAFFIGCGEDDVRRNPSPCRLFELRIDMTEKTVRAIMGAPDAIETPEAVETLDGKSYVEMRLSVRDKSYDDSLQRSTYRDDLD